MPFGWATISTIGWTNIMIYGAQWIAALLPIVTTGKQNGQSNEELRPLQGHHVSTKLPRILLVLAKHPTPWACIPFSCSQSQENRLQVLTPYLSNPPGFGCTPSLLPVSSPSNGRTNRPDECNLGPSKGAGNDVQHSSKSRVRLYGVDTPEKRETLKRRRNGSGNCRGTRCG